MSRSFYRFPRRVLLLPFLALLLTGPTLLNAQTGAGISFAVQKVGKGRPMIFIPGLDCSGEVWSDAVKHFSKEFTCYAITLPGFAGQPPIVSDSILMTVVHQLATYIRKEKLDRPVIVGHSLGGWLALAFGINHPDLAGDLVIVSSAPFLPALSMGLDITRDSAAAIGRMIKKSLVGQTPSQVRQSSPYFLSTMMRDSSRIKEVLEMSVKSDQPTQGEAMYELFSQDLRPLVGRIQSRILALADWVSYKEYGATPENVRANLEQQYKNVGSLTIAINDNSKHFIMFDAADWFYVQVDHFLATGRGQ